MQAMNLQERGNGKMRFSRAEIAEDIIALGMLMKVFCPLLREVENLLRRFGHMKRIERAVLKPAGNQHGFERFLIHDLLANLLGKRTADDRERKLLAIVHDRRPAAGKHLVWCVTACLAFGFPLFEFCEMRVFVQGQFHGNVELTLGKNLAEFHFVLFANVCEELLGFLRVQIKSHTSQTV